MISLTPFRPRNLFFIDYYKTHDLTSNDEFKQLCRDGLSRDSRRYVPYSPVHVPPRTCSVLPGLGKKVQIMPTMRRRWRGWTCMRVVGRQGVAMAARTTRLKFIQFVFACNRSHSSYETNMRILQHLHDFRGYHSEYHYVSTRFYGSLLFEIRRTVAD
jgi:hypothetical protein